MQGADDHGFLAALFLLFFDEVETEKHSPRPSAPRGAESQEPLDFPSLRFDGEAAPPRPAKPSGDA